MIVLMGPTWTGPSPRVRGAAADVAAGRPHEGTIPAGAGSSSTSSRGRTGRRDHPRGCGEQIMPQRLELAQAGPSPRVRGAEARRPPDMARDGTIPAGAGSRFVRLSRMGGGWDHPRGCGEQRAPWDQFVSVTGPSPRVRGAGHEDVVHGGLVGTIPAGAGSSWRTPTPTSTRRDHPRGCGEQVPNTADEPGIVGPSPRVRGAEPVETWEVCDDGTIPAGAGSSWRSRRRSPTARDHPRGCGEQFVGRPHTAEGGGTIPAGAGSRSRLPARNPRPGDHPRGCGEQTAPPPLAGGGLGPSPRVRGAGHEALRLLLQPGDHPRGCGEQQPPVKSGAVDRGPSPRVRGAALPVLDPPCAVGTIPAGAGSSC